MAEFKTPTAKRFRSRITDDPGLQTPIKIPPSPFLEKIGYGCGVHVFILERSPKVGFARSPWAVKKRNRLAHDNKKYNERIRFEAEMLRKLDHPNIIGFRGFTEASNGDPCLAMEKLDKSLGDIIEDRLETDMGPFSASDILKVSFEIIKGLHYLHHTAHILHGDMKSYNVLVSEDCKIIKLCDFGVSVPLTESLEIDTSKGDFSYVGTECWSAPEIIHEEGPCTNKADIWAYGLIIWEMIALSPPHVDSEDSMDESFFNDSVSELDGPCGKENQVPDDLNESISILKELTKNKFGTRPPLPAIDLGKEYQKVLETFYACTTVDQKVRPSAKGLVRFFEKYVYHTSD